MFIELKLSKFEKTVTVAIDKITAFYEESLGDAETTIFLEGGGFLGVLEDYQTVKGKVIDCVNEWHAND